MKAVGSVFVFFFLIFTALIFMKFPKELKDLTGFCNVMSLVK